MRVVCWFSLVLVACSNPCEELCLRMADYAESCGYSVPESEIDACVEAQASVSKDDAQTCRDNGTAEQIRDEWACDELAPYFQEGPTL